MADTKALFTQRFDAARAALTAGDDPAAAEALHWAIVAARSDPTLRLELASALFHLGKLSRKFGKAGETEAEPLLTEALTISEEIFGREHAALAPLLNELSRLHLKQAQYVRAEDALERLLAIAGLRGEEHPDVAVALAGLAFVKRKLGDEASAEALYRGALRIREKVLEPNNMLTVVTMEQLSETCAARGNFAEAVALLHRVLPTREAALGAGHETVRAVRSRIAELDLQVAIAADTAAAAANRAARGSIPTPAWFKRVPDTPDTPPSAAASPNPPKELEFLGEPEPRGPRTAPRPRERAKTPAVAAAAVAASLMASPMKTPAVAQIVIPPPESAHPSEPVAALPDVAYDDASSVGLALVESAPSSESALALVETDFPDPAPRKRLMLYASAAAAAVVIAIAGLLMLKPHAGSGAGPATKVNPAQRTTTGLAPVVTQAAAPTAAAGAAGAAAMVGVMRAESLHSPGAAPAPGGSTIKPEQRTAENAQPEIRAPRVDIHLGNLSIPNIPAANVDSIVRSTAERQRASDTERTAAPAEVRPSAPADADDAATPPKLIGRAPAPRYPDALLRSARSEGGEVVVRFKVNEQGRVDVASMLVVRSDHELFTAAVSDILPQFRFEPARTRALKPVAAWVTVPFRFTRR